MANRFIVLLETYPDGKLSHVAAVCRAEKRQQAEEWARDAKTTAVERKIFEVEEAT